MKNLIIELNDEVHRKLKVLAAKNGKTMSEIVREKIDEAVKR